MSVQVSKTAPGKINLFFAVGDVQENGYHPVASLYSSVSLIEKVTVSVGSSQGISQSVSIAEGSPLAEMEASGAFDIASVPLDEKNLAYRGALAVIDAQGLSVEDVSLHLHIEKAVPVAGGMGGGSADAAAAMAAVNEYLVRTGIVATELSAERLLELAAPLGADVPFALQGGISVGLGVGDQLKPVELPEATQPLHLVMVPASFGLSTPHVFAELDRGRAVGDYLSTDGLEVPEALIEALQAQSAPVARVYEIARYIENDLAAPACALAPALKKTLAIQHEGIISSFVSGSGPTIAFLMDSAESAHQLEAALKRKGRFAVAVEAPIK